MVPHHYHPAPAAVPPVAVPPAAVPPPAAVVDVDADARPVARVVPMARVNLVQGSFRHFFLFFK